VVAEVAEAETGVSIMYLAQVTFGVDGGERGVEGGWSPRKEPARGKALAEVPLLLPLFLPHLQPKLVCYI